jgi:localization factor PodJL
MSGPTPWSVKGIDPRAREAAREAARARGLTIGEWLNQAILANEAALAAARRGVAPGGEEEKVQAQAPPAALTAALAELAERVDANDRRAALAIGNMDRSLAAIGQRIEAAGLASRDDGSRVGELLQELREAQSALLKRMRELEEEDVAALKAGQAQQTGQIEHVEQTVSQLAQQAARTEAKTGEALRSLETSLVSLDEKLARAAAEADTGDIDARFAAIAERLSAKVEGARADFADQIAAAIGELKPEETRAALGDLSRRIAATERRHAQTIEAVSIEIKRLNEAMERRLRAVEARNDDGAAAREQVAQVAQAVERRFAQIENRDAVVVTRLSEEVTRIAERLESRVAMSESRNADAIGQIGDQIAVMADRLHERQDQIAADLVTRIADSEERQGAHLQDALAHLSAHIADAESRAPGASPVGEALSAFASRLQAIEARLSAQPPSPPPAASGAIEAHLAEHHEALREIADHLAEPMVGLEEELERDTIFVEDIEARYSRREQYGAGPPQPEGLAEARPSSDPFAPFEATGAADEEEDEEDLFWTTGAAETPRDEETETAAGRDRFDDDRPLAHAALTEDGAPIEEEEAEAGDALDQLMFDASLDPDASSSAEAKDDYLSAARRAAVAHAQARAVNVAQGKSARAANEDGARLRGLTRVALWTAAGALVAALAGGAYYFAQHNGPLRPVKRTLVLAPSKVPLDAPPGSIAEGAARAASGEPSVAPAEAAPSTAPAPPDAAPARAGPLQPSAALIPFEPSETIEQAAARGDQVAQYDLALLRLNGGDTAAGVALLKRAAARGLAMAQYRLAKLYEHGEGVPADLDEAKRWTELAAVGGNRKAMHDLGVYLASGEGDALNEAGAFKWFLQAAERGVEDSQFNLGVLYLQGRGVTADPREALFWFSVAAEAGDQDAGARAAMIERDIGGKAAAAIRRRARAFQAKPASARANGEFGPRPWAPTETLEAAVSTSPRT